MKNPLKFLLPLGDRSIIGNLLDDVAKFSRNIWVCSSPDTTVLLKKEMGRNIFGIIETQGSDYVTDTALALKRITRVPILVVPADTVVIRLDVLYDFINGYANRENGIVELLLEGEFTGISLYGKIPEGMEDLPYEEIDSHGEWMINVNTDHDYRRALQLLGD